MPIDVRAALEDDLNTPLALSRMHELADNLNIANKMGHKARQLRDSGRLIGAGQLLGLLQTDPEEKSKARTFKVPLGAKARGEPEIEPVSVVHEQVAQEARLGPESESQDEDDVNRLIAARTAARAAKNFAEADRIRDELAQEGVILEDLPDGTTDWRRA